MEQEFNSVAFLDGYNLTKKAGIMGNITKGIGEFASDAKELAPKAYNAIKGVKGVTVDPVMNNLDRLGGAVASGVGKIPGGKDISDMLGKHKKLTGVGTLSVGSKASAITANSIKNIMANRARAKKVDSNMIYTLLNKLGLYNTPKSKLGYLRAPK